MATTGINPDGSTRKREDQLPRVAAMAGWTTPQAHDATGRSKGQKAKHGTKHGCACLAMDAQQSLSGYATPRAEDAESSGMRHSRGVADTLTAQCGQNMKSSPSVTGNRAALNPALPRWLMGFPKEWCVAAILAHRSIKQRKRGSCV